jgi:hypothetical protein
LIWYHTIWVYLPSLRLVLGRTSFSAVMHFTFRFPSFPPKT